MASTNTTTQTYVTKEPDWMEALRQGLIADVKDVTAQPQQVAEYQVAGLSPEQQRAVQMAKEGIGAYKPYLNQAGSTYGQAGDMYGSAVGAALAGTQAYDPNMVNQYMNPYQEAVTQNAMKEMQRQAAIQQQGVSAQASKAGAFGGSRFGVQQAELGRNLADVQGSKILQDYSQNYSQAQTAAMNAFQNQQARTQAAGQMMLGAGQGLAGLGTNYSNLGQQEQALSQGDTSFQYNMGANLQGLNQKVLDANRLNQAMYNAEPYQRLSYYADILNKTPSGQQGMTATTAPNPSPFSQIAGLGIAGLGAARQWGGA
jgi:hypothetical protein